MRKYLRNRNGRTYFFTVVTNERRPILTTKLGRKSLRNSIYRVRMEHPFFIVACVLLPDHFHLVMELTDEDVDYSRRLRLVKSYFTRNWLAGCGSEACVSESRVGKGERGVWQRRFFEHTCRDEADLKRCVDYCHMNPVKHGLVNRVRDWPWSTFHQYVRKGEYTADWGSGSDWYGDEFQHAE